ncbi:Protein IVY1 [Tolypocladium paradoxum]|uniref:Protein IVY1 n=1 Tax=Tolypocladium paradoxum TaxID=94208 RepID=A0A2S4KU56_9HYPO|nr:Protein IVY1 [Tolypocladium paradoxum]
MASEEPSRPATPTPSQLPPVPSSPVYSIASTANPIAQFNLPLPPAPRPAHAVLTKADLEHSQDAYADLLASAKAYRLALASLSTAASSFGSALEACARLKEARAEPIGPASASMTASFTTARGACTADTLLSAAGVHHLVANHQQILSETVYRSFEVPLLHDLDKWQTVIDDEEATYQDKIRAQSKEVKRLEKEGLKLHRQRRRDVARFRAHLVELTGKLDGLTTLHADHARTLLRESQETSGRIVDASCSLVRAEVDIFEGLARKGWSGGGLDDLLEKGHDLFATDDAGGHASGATGSGEAAKLFSILPPKSILADSATSDAASRAGHNHGHSHARGDSLLAMDGDRYQSLTAVAAANEAKLPGGGTDTDSVFSADFNRPRNARPFSPQPIRRIPADVTFDSLGAMAEASRRDDCDDPQENNADGAPGRDAEDKRDEEALARQQEQDEEDEGEADPDRGRKRSQSPTARGSASSSGLGTEEGPLMAALPEGDELAARE